MMRRRAAVASLLLMVVAGGAAAPPVRSTRCLQAASESCERLLPRGCAAGSPAAGLAGTLGRQELSEQEKARFFVQYAPTLYEALVKAKLELTLKAIQVCVCVWGGAALAGRAAAPVGSWLAISQHPLVQALDLVHHYSNPLLAITFLALDGEPRASPARALPALSASQTLPSSSSCQGSAPTASRASMQSFQRGGKARVPRAQPPAPGPASCPCPPQMPRGGTWRGTRGAAFQSTR